MGRRKISIAPIKDDRNRQVTFLKRKNGLFKKAYELGVLCSADVAVIVFNANGKLFEFHSGDMDSILLRYSHYAGPAHEKRGPEDYLNKDLVAATKKGTGGKMTTLSDEDEDDDDDDDDKPHVAAGSSGVKVIPQASKGKQALRAAAERKAKAFAAGSPAGSEDTSTPSISRANSIAQLPQPQEQDSSPPQLGGTDPSAAQALFPGLQNGLPAGSMPFAMPFGAPPAGTPGLPNLAGQFPFSLPFGAGPTGLPNFHTFSGTLPIPNLNLPFPGALGWPAGLPQPGQQQSGATGGGTNAIPAWFGASSPAVAAAQQAAQGASQLQMLQQFGLGPGMPGWPGGSPADSNLQQQHQHQQQQQLFGAPQHNHSPQTHPAPAPMYGAPPSAAAPQPPQQHGTPPVFPAPPTASAANDDHHTPSGSTSIQSHASPHAHTSPMGHQPAPPPPQRQDSWGPKPRLSVAIPAEAGVKEGTQPGLVTAGGASILGAGLGAAPFVQEPQGGARGSDENNAPQKSAYAADLLPSPFYPTASTAGFSSFYNLPGASTLNGTASSSGGFQWPTAATSAPVPAPPLGVGEAPDLLRHASDHSTPGGTGGSGLADLTSAATAAFGGGGDETGGGKRGGEDAEDGGRARKRRA